ncbi:MAG: DUF4266 domain-containing protein [Verrucomicrobiales bacterium]|nr:DUF4266 domain-containing protein [Verrucomicrobiales bacterium]
MHSLHTLLVQVRRLVGLLCLAGMLAGCTHVKPWERGALADSIMLPDRDPVGKQMAEHMWFSREAASGGRGVGGGGCGCN